jgi:Alw26I/Eco31I/Esp3I family type II restriction m6 adenine DNA methyltransferase
MKNKIKLINSYKNLNYFFNELYKTYYKYLKLKDNNEIISYQKQNGIFLTPYNLALHITKNTLNLFEKNELYTLIEKRNFYFYEPFCGIGTFIITYLETLNKIFNFKKNTHFLINILDNIYFSDVDETNVKITKSLLEEYVKQFEIDYKINKNNYYIGNIIFDNLSNIKTINQIFNKNLKFNIILTNPPFRNLSSKLDNNYKILSNSIKKHLNLQKGVPNLYKISLEIILTHYLSDNSAIGIIIPGSFLKDKSSKKLRKYLLEKFILKKIYILKENSKLFAVNQHLSFFSAKKQKNNINNKEIYIIDILKRKKNIFKPDIIKKFDDNLSIISLNSLEYMILNQLSYYPKLKEIKEIDNLRGEFDLTLHKKYLTTKKTSLPLLQGKHLTQWVLKNKEFLYVEKDFVKHTNKKDFINKERLACQQISNLNKNKRLIFTLIPKNFVLGNSCNFIYVKNKNDMLYLLGLLNSYLLDWFFQKFSSNNHINNYELNELPINFDKKYKKEIINLVQLISKETSEKHIIELNRIVFDIYKINNTLALEILNNYNDSISIKLRQYYQQKKLYNHILLKISDLDMKMICSIPEGGNWKNIPANIPSKRLEKIRKTGGRTTLYGRLKWNAPSYTISTYFTRPGNGTYIHPNDSKYPNPQHRLITPREAARLQSFPDNYRFFGSKSNIATQIGNAVPPLLAFHIAKELKKNLKNTTMIDLFSGAGGLGLGFKWANFNILIANDNFTDACNTYKYNNPDTYMIEGDITKKEIKNKILKEIQNQQIGIIAGGPPCQGFSLAGKRLVDDPRNFLFKEFVELIKIIKPEMFIMENVPGILSINKGKTYKSIIEEFASLGYYISSQILNAAEFGVPQKRKRVFIIGSQNEYNFHIYPLIKEEKFLTVKDAISNLQFISPSQNDIINDYPIPETLYQKFLAGEISPLEFSNLIAKDSEIFSNNLFNFSLA